MRCIDKIIKSDRSKLISKSISQNCCAVLISKNFYTNIYDEYFVTQPLEKSYSSYFSLQVGDLNYRQVFHFLKSKNIIFRHTFLQRNRRLLYDLEAIALLKIGTKRKRINDENKLNVNGVCKPSHLNKLLEFTK